MSPEDASANSNTTRDGASEHGRSINRVALSERYEDEDRHHAPRGDDGRDRERGDRRVARWRWRCAGRRAEVDDRIPRPEEEKDAARQKHIIGANPPGADDFVQNKSHEQ